MGIPKKANMPYLSKEATTKDQKLKMQMLLFTDNDTKNTERVWKRNRFFGNQNGELTLSKRDFPENTLIYINQRTVLMVKGQPCNTFSESSARSGVNNDKLPS